MKAYEKLISVNGITDMFPQDSKAFKQLQFQEIVKIPKEKPNAEQLISISVNIEICNKKHINTAVGCSCEGQILSGKKLIIEGKIHQKIEYVADTEIQPVHVVHISSPFSTFIVLDKNCDNSVNQNYDVVGYVEDVYVKLLDKRHIFKNILFLINAVPLTI